MKRPVSRGRRQSAYSQAVGDFGFVEPFDFVSFAAAYSIEPFRDHELHGAGVVLADMGDESEDVAAGNLVFRGPTREHAIVVGQKIPKECLYDGFITTVNLTTAEALGLAVPTSILLRADEVIE